MTIRTYDELTVKILPDRAEAGRAAAADITACLRTLLREQAEVNVIFAAAPSQNETLAALAACRDITWDRINAFHMDEYVGPDKNAPYSFARYLDEHIFGRVPFRSVQYINGAAPDPAAEAARYAALLADNPPDVVVLGIGENGHIAFNDPPADFADKEAVKVVRLDEVCRRQQVHDGCFARLSEVPAYALTLTVPALVRARYMFCVVPGPAKARAVRDTLFGPIGGHCPAGILRTKAGAVLYLDCDSAALL